MFRFVSASLLALGAASAVPAQNIIIVDANQGIGSTFTSIQPAIDAASPGDRIIVRQGSYGGFTVDKPLAIVGESGASLFQTNPLGESFTVHDLPQGTDLVIRGFQLFFFIGGGFSIKDCEGRVLIDSMSTFFANSPNFITDSDQVIMNGCQYRGGVAVTRSSVSFADCNITGDGDPTNPIPGITATDSDVTVARSQITGGQGNPLLMSLSAAGMVLANGEVTILGDNLTRIAAGVGILLPEDRSAIEGAGKLTIDPDVSVIPSGVAVPIAATVTTTTQDLPWLSATGGLIGGFSKVTLFGEFGDSYYLLVGRPGNAIPVPAFGGAIWLDLQNTGLVSSGTIGPGNSVTFNFPVLEPLAVLGVQVHWVGLTGTTSLQLTNNVGYTHGF